MSNNVQPKEYINPEVTEYDFIDYTLGGEPVMTIESQNGEGAVGGS